MDKKTRDNIIVLLMAFGMAVFFWHRFLYSPLQKKHAETADKLKQTQTRLDDMKRRAMELDKLKVELSLLEMEVSELEKCLPKDKEIPDLLRTITKVAQRYQLKISAFAPSGTASLPNYNELQFQVTLQGTYHSLAHFLAELGQEPRILSARNIVLNPVQPSRDNNESTVNASFMLVAYTFKG